MQELNLLGWLNLSDGDRPCYSLICEQATGGEDKQLVKYKGVWMTKGRQAFLDRYNTKFEIMELPHEIRRLVLELDAVNFLQPHRFHIPVYLRDAYGRTPTAIPLPPITQAGDRQLRLEAIHVVLELATLEIHSGPVNARLQKWLASIDIAGSGNTRLQKGFDTIKSLLFPYFSRFPHRFPSITVNNDIELMRRCTNLRSVTVQWVDSELCTDDGKPKDVEQLRKEYRLGGMLDLPMFEVLTMRGPGEYMEGHEAMVALKKWFESEYQKREMMAKVLLPEMWWTWR